MMRTNDQSPLVVYASRCGAKLDSDVHHGGGTDDTLALQSVLDEAPRLGSLRLVMDGAALVRGLDVHSNTTIECLNPACGFFLAAGSDRSILRNAHPRKAQILDRNITLLGGTYNHNCLHQKHHLDDNTWVVTLAFHGVECLTMRDVTIRNQRTFAMLLTNWRRITMENIYIDLPDKIPFGNQDGIHIQGPGQFLTMRNIQGCSWDDFIAINADDVNAALDEHGNLSWNDALGPDASYGSVSDVLIDGVILNDAAQGIRLLTRGSRLDRIVISNVIGTYRSFGFYISPWLAQDPAQKVKQGGNFGHIIFDTVDLRHTAPNYDCTPPFLFHLDGRIDSLTIRNLHHHEPIDPRPLVHVLKDARVGALTVNGLHISETGPEAADARYLTIDGAVDDLTVRGADIRRGAHVPIKGSLIGIGRGAEDAAVGRIRLSDVSVRRMDSLVSQAAGKVGTVQMANVLAEDMGRTLVRHDGGAMGHVLADGVHGARPV
ncbi:MAG: hypothetical protein GX446_09235 [Chthonomonadales bacterium]|nr:hypothetical protein [Chthonomonadales bacterium]